MHIGTLFHTLRHLKAWQIIGQARHRLRPLWERPEAWLRRPVPDFEGICWEDNTIFLAPGAQLNTAADVLEGRFTFLNQTANPGWLPKDWHVDEQSLLWQYNLHYFEWLWALDFDDVCVAIKDWIERHGLLKGNVGWEPYPTSLRLMNWCAVCFSKYRSETRANPDFLNTVWRSIYLQTEWLSRHLETHLLGNHLFENGAALAFAGSCFSGDSGSKWLNQGLAILGSEIPEQILSDGMHFERSPMYHLRMTYLMRLLWDTKCDLLRQMIEMPHLRMKEALGCLCHPDGDIALFNDSAFGIYNLPTELLTTEASLGPWSLRDAGYYGYRGGDGSYIICDAGSIGPDYIPGHAHGDIFSFELSLKGHRVIVDSGVYDYVPGDMRQYCRSTQAHNTVEINGQDQCEFWSAFRVARRGYPRDVLWAPRPDGFELRGWHDGYQRLPGAPKHYRAFLWNKEKGLEVHDRIESRKTVQAVSRLHLHPDCHVQSTTDREVFIGFPDGGQCCITFNGTVKLSVEQAWYCSGFGCRERTAAISCKAEGKAIEMGFTLVSS